MESEIRGPGKNVIGFYMMDKRDGNRIAFRVNGDGEGVLLVKASRHLESCDIPPFVTAIGTGAFEGCYKLEEITLHKGIVEIGNEAFKDCTNLRRVYIEGNIRHIQEGTFKGCNSLEYVGTNYEIMHIDDGNNLESIIQFNQL